MAKFVATQTFLHGRDRYEEGRDYDSPDALVAYFVLNGWAKSDDVAQLVGPLPQEVALEVQDAGHQVTSRIPPET